MSYFVKGGVPPKSCGNCPYNYSSIKCTITKSAIDRDEEYRERLSDCPIVEVKAPHNRLIDVNEIEMPCLETTADQKWMEIAIKSAPTVIEAEGRE